VYSYDLSGKLTVQTVSVDSIKWPEPPPAPINDGGYLPVFYGAGAREPSYLTGSLLGSVKLRSKSAIQADFEHSAPASAAHAAPPSGALKIAPFGHDLLHPSGRWLGSEMFLAHLTGSCRSIDVPVCF